LDGIWLKRSWGGEVRKVAVLVAVGVRSDGYREILGVAVALVNMRTLDSRVGRED